jgi:hypothetical protein
MNIVILFILSAVLAIAAAFASFVYFCVRLEAHQENQSGDWDSCGHKFKHSDR